MSKTAYNLHKMLEVLGPNGEHWTKYDGLSNRAWGVAEKRDDECYCIIGARNMTLAGNPFSVLPLADSWPASDLGYRMTPETRALWKALPKKYKKTLDNVNNDFDKVWAVVNYNDGGPRNFADIKKLIEKAIRKA